MGRVTHCLGVGGLASTRVDEEDIESVEEEVEAIPATCTFTRVKDSEAPRERILIYVL